MPNTNYQYYRDTWNESNWINQTDHAKPQSPANLPFYPNQFNASNTGGLSNTFEGATEVKISEHQNCMYEEYFTERSSQEYETDISISIDQRVEQQQKNNVHHNYYTRILTYGSAWVDDQKEEVRFGKSTAVVVVKIKDATTGNINIIQLPTAKLTSKNKELENELASFGLKYKKRDSFARVADFLHDSAFDMKHSDTVYKEGAYLDAEGSWHLPNESDQMNSAVYSTQLQQALGAAPDSQDLSTGFRDIIKASLYIEAQSAHLFAVKDHKIYVFETPTPAEDSHSFADELDGNHVSKLSEKIVNNLRSGLSVINNETCSQHTQNTHLPTLLDISCDKVVAIFAKKQNNIAEVLGFNRIITMEYREPTGLKSDFARIKGTAVREMVTQKELQKSFLNPADLERFGEFPEEAREFASRTVALARHIFSCALGEAETKMETKKFINYLRDCLGAAYLDTSEKIISFLKQSNNIVQMSEICYEQRYDELIGVSNDRIALTPKAFSKLAEHLGYYSSSVLAKEMRKRGYLITGSRLEIPVSVQGGQINMYVIAQSALMGLGNLRFGTNEFYLKAPKCMIPIGQNGRETLYYAIPDFEGTVNGHTYICGDSGSGKSFFLGCLARSAINLPICVTFICTELPKDHIDGALVKYITSRSGKHFEPGTVAELSEKAIKEGKLDETEKYLLQKFSSDDNIVYNADSYIDYLKKNLDYDIQLEKLIGIIKSLINDGLFSSTIDWSKIFIPHQVSYLVIEGNDKLKNNIISDFYKAKCALGSLPSLLIIDECQNFDLCHESPINEILRKGRKNGISLFLASQYLTAEDARNIDKALKQCRNNVIFSPVNDCKTRRKLGIRDTDREMAAFLSQVPQYTGMIYGDVFASERGYLRYPLMVKASAKLEKSSDVIKYY